MTESAALPSLSRPAWIVAGLVAAAVAALCSALWPHWTDNPDLSHGLFAPVLFVILIREARRRATPRFLNDTKPLAILRGVSLALGVALVAMGGLYAAALDWSHSLVAVSFSCALSLLLLGALLWACTSSVRAVPLNWTSLVAIGLWPLCSPLPPGTYSRFTLQLQLWVTDIVLHALHILGIPASTSGNVILLAQTSVGVEEACSGVRSLISCFVAAVFFSATLVHRPSARALLIALAPPLAFTMNIVRSLTLTLLANAGVDIKGAWHDLTGFAVLGVTALVLGALALRLEDQAPAAPATTPIAPPTARAPRGLLVAYALVLGLVVFFVASTHAPRREASPPPDLVAILPTAPASWEVVRTDDLYQFAPILATDHLLQRTYVRRRADGSPLEITVYLAYWAPGQTTVSAVAMHTPEACWPGGGWTMQPVASAEQPFTARDLEALATPEYRSFTQNGDLRHVWYWHLYDGRSITQTDPLSPAALLHYAWRYGFSTAGEQLFVRISSNRPWSEIRNESLIADILRPLQKHGL